MHTICTLSQKWSARPGLTILITTCGDSTYPSAPPGTRTPNLLIKRENPDPGISALTVRVCSPAFGKIKHRKVLWRFDVLLRPANH